VTDLDSTLEALAGTAVAMCLGALVGLERQVSEGESQGAKDFPGVRTLAFTALVGALAVLISRPLGPWPGAAMFLALSAFLVLRYRYDMVSRDDPGYTTEIAAICTFGVGALAQSGELLLATVIAIVMAALLRGKRALHHAGDLLAPQDMEALIRFLVIAGVVLPLLPTEPLDLFYGVLSPRDVWRMVVLISGVSFAAYVLMRFRATQGVMLTSGLLSGLVSGTAAAVTYARAARTGVILRHWRTMALLSASASYVRLLILLAVRAPSLLVLVLPPILAMSATCFALGIASGRDGEAPPTSVTLRNPLTLRLALSFAATYAVALVLIETTRQIVAGPAFYGTSAVAALFGADAPMLSLARLALDTRIDATAAATGIVAVVVTSTLGKAGIAYIFGPRAYASGVAARLFIAAAVGIATAVVWQTVLLRSAGA
jgi:uncharacterized membrane protein (DUF4010 family)